MATTVVNGHFRRLSEVHPTECVEGGFAEVFGILNLAAHQELASAGPIESPDLAQPTYRVMVNKNVGHRSMSSEVRQPGAQ